MAAKRFVSAAGGGFGDYRKTETRGWEGKTAKVFICVRDRINCSFQVHVYCCHSVLTVGFITCTEIVYPNERQLKL